MKPGNYTIGRAELNELRKVIQDGTIKKPQFPQHGQVRAGLLPRRPRAVPAGRLRAVAVYGVWIAEEGDSQHRGTRIPVRLGAVADGEDEKGTGGGEAGRRRASRQRRRCQLIVTANLVEDCNG